MEQTIKTKAIFVGISYKLIPLKQVGWAPFCYAKNMAKGLAAGDVFKEQECVIFGDFKKDNVGNIQVKPPSKKEIIDALLDMITNAKAGDICLFYYCGHGVAFVDPSTDQFIERGGNWGSLSTLKEAALDMIDPLYDTEFKGIISKVAQGVHLTMLIHCCHSGVMFVHPNDSPSSYIGPGIALTSVDATIPTSFEPSDQTFMGDMFSRENDFTKFIIQVIEAESCKKWPKYKDVFANLTKVCLGKTASSTLIAKLPSYCKQRVTANPSLLQEPKMYFNLKDKLDEAQFLNGGP